MAHDAAPTPSDEPAAPSGMKAKMPLIALVAVGLAVGGGTGAAVIGPMVAKKMGRGTAPAAASAKQHGDEESASGDEDADAGGDHAATDEAGKGEGSAEGEKGGETAASVHLLDNLVLNPAGSGGSRFLLLSVAIEAASAAKVAAFKERDAELRDVVLTALGNKSVDQLTDIAGRDSIKTELQTAIIARFGKKSVKRLYFPQFVVQ